MAYAISDGVPCKDAVHVFTSTSGQTATINGPGVHDGGTRNRVILVDAPDFYDTGDPDAPSLLRTAQPGGFPLPSERGTKLRTYKCLLVASTLPGLRALAAPFRGAFRRRFPEGRMVITPGSAWGTIPWSFTAEPWLTMGSEVYVGDASEPWQQEATVYFLMNDPRDYVWSTAPTASAASGVSATATNSGNDDTDPTFTITVPGGTPDIHLENTSVTTSNGTADLWLRAVPTGSLVIDFRSRTILLGGANAIGYFDSAYTDWWDELIPGLKPGANTIQVTGGAWSATWRHAST